MSTLNIVKILFISKLVLHSELLKKLSVFKMKMTKIVSDFFVAISRLFLITLKKITGKIENRVK